MDILKAQSTNRQASLFARAKFDYTHFDGTNFVPALDLPDDAVVISGKLGVDSAFDAALTLSVGTSAAPTELLAATAADALGCTDLTEDYDGAKIGVNKTVGLTPSAAPTQGSGSLLIEYIRERRGQVTQG